MIVGMGAIQQRVSWVYGLIPALLLLGLLLVVAGISGATANDPAHLARKVANGYVVVGSISSMESTNALRTLARENFRAVASSPRSGRVNILVPEEHAEEAIEVLRTFEYAWKYEPTF